MQVSTTQKSAYDGSNVYADLSSTGTVTTLYLVGAGGGQTDSVVFCLLRALK